MDDLLYDFLRRLRTARPYSDYKNCTLKNMLIFTRLKEICDFCEIYEI